MPASKHLRTLTIPVTILAALLLAGQGGAHNILGINDVVRTRMIHDADFKDGEGEVCDQAELDLRELLEDPPGPEPCSPADPTPDPRRDTIAVVDEGDVGRITHDCSLSLDAPHANGTAITSMAILPFPYTHETICERSYEANEFFDAVYAEHRHWNRTVKDEGCVKDFVYVWVRGHGDDGPEDPANQRLHQINLYMNWINDQTSTEVARIEDGSVEDYYLQVKDDGSFYAVADLSGDSGLYVGETYVGFPDNVPIVLNGIQITKAPDEDLGQNAKRWTVLRTDGATFGAPFDGDENERLVQLLTLGCPAA